MLLQMKGDESLTSRASNETIFIQTNAIEPFVRYPVQSLTGLPKTGKQ